MLGYIKEFITYFFVTRYDEAACAAANCVRQSERCATPLIVTLEV